MPGREAAKRVKVSFHLIARQPSASIKIEITDPTKATRGDAPLTPINRTNSGIASKAFPNPNVDRIIFEKKSTACTKRKSPASDIKYYSSG
jgi:hypothetical protein